MAAQMGKSSAVSTDRIHSHAIVSRPASSYEQDEQDRYRFAFVSSDTSRAASPDKGSNIMRDCARCLPEFTASCEPQICQDGPPGLDESLQSRADRIMTCLEEVNKHFGGSSIQYTDLHDIPFPIAGSPRPDIERSSDIQHNHDRFSPWMRYSNINTGNSATGDGDIQSVGEELLAQ